MGPKKPNGCYANQNGYINGHLPTTVTGNAALQKISHVIRSMLPIVFFLTIYALNPTVHVLPMVEDIGCVHIHTINAIEEFLFGCHPHRFVSALHNPFLDMMSAVPYLIHYIIPIVFPLYLLLKGQFDDIPRFYWLIGWTMWAHFLIWLIFPHTPPWVLDNIHRYNLTSSTAVTMKHREGCAFERLDRLTGQPFFYNMFLSNPIPYASFPSGHVAWPTVIHVIGGPGGNYFTIYLAWMIWATMYTCHHYVLDAIGALVLVWITQRVLKYLTDKQVCSSDYKCRPVGIACPFHV